jgi:hypothetical protein
MPVRNESMGAGNFSHALRVLSLELRDSYAEGGSKRGIDPIRTPFSIK